MKTKFFMIFLLGLILPLLIKARKDRKLGQPPTRQLHRKKLRHHRRIKKSISHHQHTTHKKHRALKRRIYKQDDDDLEDKKISELSDATKLGFEQGLKYAKRHLDEEEEGLQDETPEEAADDLKDNDDHSSESLSSKLYNGIRSPVGIAGTAGFLSGSLDKNSKLRKAKLIEENMKSQFAFKDSVIGILTKEIQDLNYLNQQLGSAGRRVGTTENNLMQRVQEKIFESYSMKKH